MQQLFSCYYRIAAIPQLQGGATKGSEMQIEEFIAKVKELDDTADCVIYSMDSNKFFVGAFTPGIAPMFTTDYGKRFTGQFDSLDEGMKSILSRVKNKKPDRVN